MSGIPSAAKLNLGPLPDPALLPHPRHPTEYTTTWPIFVGFNEIHVIKFGSRASSGTQQIQTIDLRGGSALTITSPSAIILGSVHPLADERTFAEMVMQVYITRDAFREHFSYSGSDGEVQGYSLIQARLTDGTVFCPSHERIFMERLEHDSRLQKKVHYYHIRENWVHGIISFWAVPYSHPFFLAQGDSLRYNSAEFADFENPSDEEIETEEELRAGGS
jgi:hypothetical protein